MSRLGLTRDKIYKTVARQLHGVVPCWMCGEHVLPADATLEHIQPLSEGGSSHQRWCERCQYSRSELGYVHEP